MTTTTTRQSVVPVPKLWPGGTIAIIANGPSLTAEDVAYVRGRVDAVIAVNNAYQIAPWADVLYGSDVNKFWTWHRGVHAFEGLKYTAWTTESIRAMAQHWGVSALRKTGDDGLEHDPCGLRTGANSAYAAINLAVHFGANRIVLLGVDMQLGARGRKHWHEDHPDGSVPPFTLCLGRFPTIVPPLQKLGVQVINCSPRSALQCFPKMDLKEAISDRKIGALP